MRHLANDDRARIEVFVDTMPEAHKTERVVLVLGLLDILANLADITNFLEHVEYGLVGASVCGAPESGNASCDCRVRIRTRAASHANGRR